MGMKLPLQPEKLRCPDPGGRGTIDIKETGPEETNKRLLSSDQRPEPTGYSGRIPFLWSLRQPRLPGGYRCPLPTTSICSTLHSSPPARVHGPEPATAPMTRLQTCNSRSDRLVKEARSQSWGGAATPNTIVPKTLIL